MSAGDFQGAAFVKVFYGNGRYWVKLIPKDRINQSHPTWF